MASGGGEDHDEGRPALGCERASVLIRFTTSLLLCGSGRSRMYSPSIVRPAPSLPPSFPLPPPTQIEDRRQKIDHAKRDCVKTDHHSRPRPLLGERREGEAKEDRGERERDKRCWPDDAASYGQGNEDRKKERRIDRSRNAGDGCKSRCRPQAPAASCYSYYPSTVAFFAADAPQPVDECTIFEDLFYGDLFSCPFLPVL